jgi:AcrR family transcriptional regulator
MTTPVHRRLIAAGAELALERYAAGGAAPLDLAAPEVAARAGVARSAFYSLWPDVDGTRKSFDRYLDELVRHLGRPRLDHRDLAVAALSGPGDWEAALARLLQALVRSLWGSHGGEHRARSAIRAAAALGDAPSHESEELALALELVSRGHGVPPRGADWSEAATLLLVLAEGVLAVDVEGRLAVRDGGTMRTTDKFAAAAAALMAGAT